MRVVNESGVRSAVIFWGWCAEHWSGGPAAPVPTALYLMSFLAFFPIGGTGGMPRGTTLTPST